MEKSELNLKEAGLKARSKGEIYRLFVTEGNIYLPPMRDTSHYFLSQIAKGEK